MYQPETEDMLPRAAPKPTADQANPMLQAKPTVPEVSLIFAQQQNPGITPITTQLQASSPSTQSYAQWKKQTLPRVAYFSEPALNKEHELGAVRSSLYPLRAAITNVSKTITGSNNNANLNLQTNGTCNDMKFRRYLEAEPGELQYYNSNANLQHQQPQQQPQQFQQRRSLDNVPMKLQNGAPSQKAVEVLTICAGTQTEPWNGTADNQNLANFVTKSEFQKLCSILQDMRAEQQRLMQMCEVLLVANAGRGSVNDMGTQCEILALNNANAVRRPMNLLHDCIVEESPQSSPTSKEPAALTSNNYYNQLKEPTQQYQQQTQLSKPMAQSTTYRPNTPPVNANLNQECQGNVVNVLPKATTEKSMVMNELALKYLPNEKLNELLQELQIAQATTPTKKLSLADAPQTPLRAIDANYIKAPNDMSNASYKYLKKYRLLPEEEAKLQQQQQMPAHENNENMPSPLLLRSKQQQQSPFQRTQSPLAGRQSDAQLQIDLEHIRNQPKFF